METEKEDTGDRGPEKFQRQEAEGDVRDRNTEITEKESSHWRRETGLQKREKQRRHEERYGEFWR